MKDIADTTSREVTIIGLLAVANLTIGLLWHRRELNWDKKFLKVLKEKDDKVEALQNEIKNEVRSHSEEMKKAHEEAVSMGQRAMTMIQLSEKK